MNLEMRFRLMNVDDVANDENVEIWIENVEIWSLNCSYGLWIWNIWDTRFPGLSVVACHHVYQVENSILCWPYDVSVTGHYINSRECYPHWAILIIWEKAMHRLLGCTSGDSLRTIQTCRVGWITDRWASSAIGQACIICILLELLACVLTGCA